MLSPSDFLYPGVESYSSVSILAPEPPGPDALRYSWRTARHIIDGFWKRWSREYVASLQARSKWNATKEDIRIGQMVLITDEVPRDQWKLAIVVSLEGDATHVRGARVRIATGKTYNRDVRHLVALELDG